MKYEAVVKLGTTIFTTVTTPELEKKVEGVWHVTPAQDVRVGYQVTRIIGNGIYELSKMNDSAPGSAIIHMSYEAIRNSLIPGRKNE